MKTKQTRVEGTAYIFAVPKTEYTLKRELDEVNGDASKVMPFEYEIRSFNSHFRDDAVLVHEFSIVGTVPEGIDLVVAAVETLRAEIVKVRTEADKRVAEIEKKIRNLALLTYQHEEA